MINKYRGKSIKSGKWIYGNLIQTSANKIDGSIQCYIFPYPLFIPGRSLPTSEFIEVLPETVGRFTTMTDTSYNTKELYEGDIIENGNGIYLEIYWNMELLQFKQRVCNQKNVIEKGFEWDAENRTDIELMYNLKILIGNIHDNPELLDDGH